MVRTEHCRTDLEHFAQSLHNSSSMNPSLEIKQRESFPTCVNSGSCLFSLHTGVQRFAIPPLPSVELEHKNIDHVSHQCSSQHLQTSLRIPTTPKEKESLYSAIFSEMPVPDSNIQSNPKGFLIFDQSGNQRRLMYTSLCRPLYIPSADPKIHHGCGWLEEQWAAGDCNSVKYFPHTPFGVDHVATGDESEMHENTEEIDALLYSDDYTIGYSSEDEVTSTGHSPEPLKEYNEMVEGHHKITSDVSSSDGPRKRQKVHDRGQGYVKPPQAANVTHAKVDEIQKFISDGESSSVIGEEEGNVMDVGVCDSPSKKDRIRETLTVLESLVPGAKGKDPLLVIDEAIDYLKSLKHEASALGVSCY